MRLLGALALLAVIAQGVLGGITVLYLLPTPVSVAHATLAQSFFCLVVSMTLFTSSEWKQPQPKIAVEGNPRKLFLLTSAAVYLQLILGAWVRHSGAALAIPDFPLAMGKLIPEFTSPQVSIHFAHRVGAVVVFALISGTLVSVLRRMRKEGRFVFPAALLLILSVCQVALGGYTVLTRKAVPVATAHVAVGALILATSVVLTLRGYRHLEPVSSISLEGERFASGNLERMKPL
jgi:cytochrome c oxidase assembly protein subunit 15